MTAPQNTMAPAPVIHASAALRAMGNPMSPEERLARQRRVLRQPLIADSIKAKTGWDPRDGDGFEPIGIASERIVHRLWLDHFLNHVVPENERAETARILEGV